MKDVFHFVHKPHNLRNDLTLPRQRNCRVYFGAERIPSLAPEIWELVPCNIVNAKSIDIFFKKNSGQQMNVLADFPKRTLANVDFV